MADEPKKPKRDLEEEQKEIEKRWPASFPRRSPTPANDADDSGDKS